MMTKLNDALSTGFPLLDKVVGGLKNGSLTIIKGGPCTGKMSLLLYMLLNSVMQGHVVGFFCNQYDLKESIGRLYIMSELSEEDENRIFVNDQKDLNLKDFEECAESMVKKGVDVLFVHTIELLDCENAGAILSRITKALKELAIKLNVPIVAAMMGGHTHSKRLEDGRYAIAPPSISREFKEYPDVVSFADAIWLLHRPSAYRNCVDIRFIKELPGYNAELMIAKNEKGNLCIIPLSLDKNKLVFKEVGDSVLQYSEEENVKLYGLIDSSSS